MSKIDKIIFGFSVGLLIIFIITALLYERPESQNNKLNYLPPVDFVGVIDKGRRLFDDNCAVCHGKKLNGSDKGPPLIHPYYRPKHHGDIAVYMAVKNGVVQHHWQFGNMPPVDEIKPEQAGHILVYIRSEQRKAGLF